MKTSAARRHFLSQMQKFLGLGVLAQPMVALMFEQILQKAFAQTLSNSNSSNFYLHLSFPGAPPRWQFDLPLTPFGKTASNFKPGAFGTQFNGQSVEYAVRRLMMGSQEIYLPPVWEMNLASQNFSNLLPHTVFIRGMNMEINNHGLSNARQLAPIIGGYSVSGAVADGSGLPIPSIVDLDIRASAAFRSFKGLTTQPITYTSSDTTNPAILLLAPFSDFRQNRPLHAPSRTAAQERALASFEEYATTNGLMPTSLPLMYDSAIALVTQNFSRLADEWPQIFSKYQTLVNEAIFPNKGQLPGVFDVAVAGSRTSDPEKNPFAFSNEPGSVITAADLRDMVVPDRTNLPKMAENFAMAEIMLGTVTPTMTLGFGPIEGLSQDGSQNRLFDMTHDQHNVGNMAGLLPNTLFYRAFLGCLTEFVARLKAKNIFDQTVIHIASEFNRNPKNDGSGSDHGYDASNTTLISGMIRQGGVIGNILVNPAGGERASAGTYGVSDSYDLGGMNREIQVNDVALTLTQMLGVQSVVTNGRSLLVDRLGKWEIAKAEARNNG